MNEKGAARVSPVSHMVVIDPKSGALLRTLKSQKLASLVERTYHLQLWNAAENANEAGQLEVAEEEFEEDKGLRKMYQDLEDLWAHHHIT